MIFFILSVFVASISQVLLKKSANNTHSSFIREYLNPYVIIGYFLFFASTILAILGYKHLPLKFGPVLESLGYVFILILSIIFFNEKIGKNKIIGTLLIVLGIIIFSI
ncbi:MAG: EamA family transporter [Spirochaetales bacterium]|nr:EamA family transporter [Spirochaetales bacterium]